MSSWIDLSSNDPLWLMIRYDVSKFSIPSRGTTMATEVV